MEGEPFQYRQRTFRPDETAAMAEAMHEDGCVLIPDVLSQEEVLEYRAAMDRLRPFANDSIHGDEHYKCIFNRERCFLELADRPGIVDLADATMGDQCHILGLTGWKCVPGHNGWNCHIDHSLIALPEEFASDPRVKMPVHICTAHYYLNDMSLDLCPTYVIPGSHKSGRGPEKSETSWHGRELEPVLCKAGDVLVFRSDVWHSGSVNKTQETRYLIQVHYSLRTIAQRFTPFPFIFNQEILAVANARQLRLLGKHPEMAYG